MMGEDDELRMFADGIRRALESGSVAEVDAALEELGWLEAWSELGGGALRTAFTLAGELRVDAGMLDGLLALSISGQTDAAFILPRVGTSEPPGVWKDGVLSVAGAATPRLLSSEYAIVVHGTGTAARAAQVPAAPLRAALTMGIDAPEGFGGVALDVEPIEDLGEVDWEGIVELGRLALSCELVGLGRGMIALAREHALSRIQFGRPIAGFQAVRHRLVEALLAVEAADAAVTETLRSIDAEPETRRTHAAMSKALAGLGARTAARHCQQVLAGIGFTVEHPFHRYLRRALVLDELFGSARSLTREIGEEALRRKDALFELAL
ncbi:MAG: acyl-CoA dehydrogenase family protein [Microbacterium sp.]